MPIQELLPPPRTPVVISVVDDDDSVRKSLQRLLKSMGFQVKTFASALEFLDHGSFRDQGCAIVDVRMPHMNGLELQKRLVQAGISLPLIFITAYEDPGVREQAQRAGAVAFLQKPFNEQTLREAVCAACK